jgi:cell division protein ZipA
LPEIHVRDRLVEPPLVDLDDAISVQDRGNSIPVMQAERLEDDAAAVDERPVVADERSTESDHRPTESVPSAGAARAAPAMALPKDSEPVIVALRVVAREGERLTGAALRQALQGEGFVHGEMNIFHRALADGRVLMSAASLTKPGSFDLATMDSSRFLGINLFAVLPGPIAGRDAVDKLLSVGHTLAQRLRAQLLDSRGQPLTESRLAEMRREAAAAGGG